MTDTITNTELASRLSRTIDRWDRRETQMIDFISQPEGTVIVTDGVNVDHELPSFPQLQANVTALTDTLTGAVAQAQDINSASVQLLNETSAGVGTVQASLVEAQAAAAAAQDAHTAAAASAHDALSRRNAAAQHATSAGQSATTAGEQADIASGAMEIAADAADIAVTERAAAQTAATTAAQHATRARDWANRAVNVVVADGQYSARHWAQQAQNAASGAMSYQGTWSAASGQFPASPVKGHLYTVATAGTAGGISFAVGDQVIYNGSAWEKIENVQSVTSVAGKTGTVTLAAGDITSGTLATARIPALSISKVTGLQTALNGKPAAITIPPVPHRQ